MMDVAYLVNCGRNYYKNTFVEPDVFDYEVLVEHL